MIRKYTNLTFFALVWFLALGLDDDIDVMTSFASIGLVLLSPWFVFVWFFQFIGWLDDHF